MLGDGRDFTPAEIDELLGAAWDGKRRIESPFVAGDYLLVADRPRISGREARLLWEWRTFGNSQADIDRMGAILARIFPEWKLHALDGQPIGPPGRRVIHALPATETTPEIPEIVLPWAFEDLSTRLTSWVINRAIRVVIFNPLV